MTENIRFIIAICGDGKLGIRDLTTLNEYTSERQVADYMNRITDENEKLKKDRFICLDCEHSGYIEIGCLCEHNDHWQEYITECEDFKELGE